jgi:hypothetical protein
MNTSRPQPWLRAVVVTALVYVVVGLGTAALSRSATSPSLRTVWRLAAWGISAVTFAAHILRERRLRTARVGAALHPALAVALATFVLSASAVIHQVMASTMRPGLLLAFGIWPILTGVPAFLVALAAGALLRYKDPSGPAA